MARESGLPLNENDGSGGMSKSLSSVCVIWMASYAFLAEAARPGDYPSLRSALDAYRAEGAGVPVDDHGALQDWLDTIDLHLTNDQQATVFDLHEARVAALSLSNTLGLFEKSLLYVDDLVSEDGPPGAHAFWLVEQAEIATMLPRHPQSLDLIERAHAFVSEHPDVLQTTARGPSGIVVKYVSVLSRWARMLAERDQQSEARLILEQAQELSEEHATDAVAASLDQLGYDREYFIGAKLRLAAELGDVMAARADFQHLHEIGPLRTSEGEYALQVYRAIRRRAPEEAAVFLEDWFNQRGAGDPAAVGIANAIATHYMQEGKYGDSIGFLETALSGARHPEETAVLLLLLASAYDGMGNRTQAQSILEQVISEYAATDAARTAASILGSLPATRSSAPMGEDLETPTPEMPLKEQEPNRQLQERQGAVLWLGLGASVGAGLSICVAVFLHFRRVRKRGRHGANSGEC